jgi:hypothetical protein
MKAQAGSQDSEDYESWREFIPEDFSFGSCLSCFTARLTAVAI